VAIAVNNVNPPDGTILNVIFTDNGLTTSTTYYGTVYYTAWVPQYAEVMEIHGGSGSLSISTVNRQGPDPDVAEVGIPLIGAWGAERLAPDRLQCEVHLGVHPLGLERPEDLPLPVGRRLRSVEHTEQVARPAGDRRLVGDEADGQVIGAVPGDPKLCGEPPPFQGLETRAACPHALSTMAADAGHILRLWSRQLRTTASFTAVPRIASRNSLVHETAYWSRISSRRK
jgi:hypothetical protein